MPDHFQRTLAGRKQRGLRLGSIGPILTIGVRQCLDREQERRAGVAVAQALVGQVCQGARLRQQLGVAPFHRVLKGVPARG